MKSNIIDAQVELWLPEAADDGFSEDGEEPKIVLIMEWDAESFKLSELIAEEVNRHYENKNIVIDWLRTLADNLEKNSTNNHQTDA